MDDTNLWYDAYTSYLRYQLDRHAATADWRPIVVLDVVERLWQPTAAPQWDRLIQGLHWAAGEHGHADEFAIAVTLARKLAAEYAEEMKRFVGWEEPEAYIDEAYVKRQKEWERTRKMLYGDEDSTYFLDRFRWVNGG